MSLIQIMGLLLAISVAGNAWLGTSWIFAEKREATAVEQGNQARGAAEMCSAGTLKLEDAARTRAAEGLRAMEHAQQQAQMHEAKAQQILSAPPSTPGNDCKSADDRARAWLTSRNLPKGKP
jgi:hypothetical protein